MRTYILTKKEREMIAAYLEKGLALNGLAVLRSRAKKALARLEKDLEYVKALASKKR